MDTKQARELAARMLAEADSTGSATYDTIFIDFQFIAGLKGNQLFFLFNRKLRKLTAVTV